MKRLSANWRECAEGFERVKNPVSKSIAKALDQEMTRWLADPRLLPDEQVLIRAMKVPGSTIPISACIATSIIAKFHPQPVEFQTRIYLSSSARARGWMMRFGGCASLAHRHIVELGLADRSKLVREWACEGVDNGEYCDLVPRLRVLAEQDPEAEVRRIASNTADRLEQSFHLCDQDEDGKWSVIVRLSASSMTAVIISDREVKMGKAVQAVERELRLMGEKLPPPACPVSR